MFTPIAAEGLSRAGRLFCTYQGDMTPHKQAAVRISRPSPVSWT